ncbi:MAG: methylenetetrahydrofolate--tRNA-(uracil(54)-C(5))-methyltransferase (FADH(2)-oxidizing) TrmFO [Deltaproteobacteria bacterium]|nr:methylenetetrahydrofolate--tRNA-(uracil(54)-C(5))-methyltransferase (FADH(2)-oxidizing) TrmFO [Deltaproteobacteria bacterium]MBW2383409.1 methylenetetrahydrofolate--tRNA-(uracil(54)-C(5))-methyltransferase (FADH(2)-oxidizing) TrmFO [Deltaproteobacteria bacterium]
MAEQHREEPAAAARNPAPRIVVVGGGLAGCEAAWQAARRGVNVTLYDMKPVRLSPAHTSEDLAELVCSNSLRASGLTNAVGLLKEEMRAVGSLIIEAADATAVPAGRALAVDRVAFQEYVTRAITSEPRIELRRELVSEIPDDSIVVLATGPLTAPELARSLQRLLGEEYLYFYDAIAPTLYADSIDHSVVFRASRYDESGEGDYLNVALTRDEYEGFVEALLGADTVPLHKFEAALYFEGCLPIEEMARRGRDTLAFGPLKPVGLVDPRSGKRPHAVVQLRQEDKGGVLYNLVGCQTKLRVSEQQRIFRALPGLGKAIFARYGSVHRNTYVNAPRRLGPTLELRARPGLYLAGQIAGVEGYVESAALGFLAGMGAARAARGEEPVLPPRATAHGSLLAHLGDANPKHFQPMNVNYGLFPPLPPPEPVPGQRRTRKRSKREKNQALAHRALESLEPWRDAIAPTREAGR